MWLKNTTTPAIYRNLAIDTAYRKNRVTSVDGAACQYDNSGNLTRETVAGRVQTYTYDADNRLHRAVISGVGGGTVTYVYDAAGRRVRKLVQGGVATTYVYNSGGQLVAEFEGATRAKEYVYGAEGMAASVREPGTGSEVIQYTTADHLGTPRVITNGAGAVLSRYDYLPFGEEIPGNTLERTAANGYPVPPGDSVTQGFTSKERDAETGLDYFGARYYGSGLGRFTGVDEGQLNPINPQSLNRYSYTYNNPLRYIDPDGNEPQEAGTAPAPTSPSPAEVDKALKSIEKASAPKARPGLIGLLVLAVEITVKAKQTEEEEKLKLQEQETGAWSDMMRRKTQRPTDPAPAPPPAPENKVHTKGARPSTTGEHEQGQARKKRDRGGEKGDAARRPPRKPHEKHVGPWPVKPFVPDPTNPEKKKRTNPCPTCRKDVPHIEPKKQ